MNLLRSTLPYLSVVLILALAYAGWTLVSRERADKRNEAAGAAAKAQADRKIVEAYGDGRLKILSFYASPPEIKPGEKGLLCYGVVNAKSMRIEPLLERVTPSLSRCLEVNPKTTTEYKLTAQDSTGRSDSRSLSVSVR